MRCRRVASYVPFRTSIYLLSHFSGSNWSVSLIHTSVTLLFLSLDNGQLDAHLLYFTVRPLPPSTGFERYMLIIRRLNCIDEASGIVLSVSGLPVHRLCTGRPLTESDDTRYCINKIQHPDYEHIILETCRGL